MSVLAAGVSSVGDWGQAAPAPDAQVFKAAMSDMPASVCVITTRGAGGVILGTTLSAVSSLSLDPPMMLACFDKRSNTLAALTEGTEFLIHLLAEGQEAVASRMASKGDNKFDQVEWVCGPGNLPQIANCAAVLHCAVENRLPGGDHIIVTGRVRSVRRENVSPLVYYRRSFFPISRQENPQ